MPVNPFVVGQWVRGDRFYGRVSQIEEILGGHRNWIWLLGTRRIGKTSLLKQLEHLAWTAPERTYFPVFWDFQGADSVEELFRTFREALLDAEERLEELGVDPGQVNGGDLFDAITRLRRRLKSVNLKLLLLCDEVEELITLNRLDPALLRKLRRVMQSQEDVRSILASTIRLWALADEKGDTSPFLHGFTPPLYIQSLSDDEARALIGQQHLAPGARPQFAAAATEEIRSSCDNHPYLIQLVCKRFLESGDLADAMEQVRSDEMVGHFFSVDFEMLSSVEKDVVRIVGEASAASSDSILRSLPVEPSSLDGALHRLESLGYLRRGAGRRFELVNHFFRRWVMQRPRSARSHDDNATAALENKLSQQATQAGGGPPNLYDGRYTLLERLGEGANGVVHKAKDELLNEVIALKILRPELSGSAVLANRIRREALVARDLNHPNLLKVYHLGECQGRMYLAMKLIEGPTLAQRISRSGALNPARVLEIGRKLASALEAAHGQKVIHRDIKPQNILLDASGEPHLTDFGLARLTDGPGFTRGGTFLGTPQYASPEQARLLPADERSDIYSLGIVLYEMVTGRAPFMAESVEEVLRMHCDVPPRDLRRSPSELSPALAAIIMKALEKEPSHRFQTSAELRKALEDVR